MSRIGTDPVSRGGGAPELLRELVSHRLPAAVLRDARAAGAHQAAMYVIDIDGSCLIKVGGDERFPDRIQAPLGVGPELPRETFAQINDIVTSKVPEADVTPLCVRDRAVGILVTEGGRPAGLRALADHAALALELANDYTDAIHRVRRRKDISAAAEIQQNLLPPRITSVEGAHVVCGVLPGYEVGGDFVDYADNDDGLWLAVGDAMGKGNPAAALSSLAVGALRAARRSNANLEQAAQSVHEASFELGGPYHFLTAVLAVWHPDTHTLAWINCGHPRPLVIDHDDGTVTELIDEGTYPLGLFRRERSFRRTERRIQAGQRVLLYSDGIHERQDAAGNLFGIQNITRTLLECAHTTTAGTVRALQDAVLEFSPRPLRDDATILLVDTDPAP